MDSFKVLLMSTEDPHRHPQLPLEYRSCFCFPPLNWVSRCKLLKAEGSNSHSFMCEKEREGEAGGLWQKGKVTGSIPVFKTLNLNNEEMWKMRNTNTLSNSFMAAWKKNSTRTHNCWRCSSFTRSLKSTSQYKTHSQSSRVYVAASLLTWQLPIFAEMR